MKNLEMIIEMENGQLAIDFDSLELITSKEFVNTIKNCTCTDIKNIRIETSEKSKFVRVYILDSIHFLYTYIFDKSDGYIVKNRLSPTDVEMFIEMGGEYL